MVDLTKKKCAPCAGGLKPLNESEALTFLKNLEGWELVKKDDKPSAIQQNIKTKNFAEAINIVNKIGEIAEEENHHPDIKFGWGYVDILIQTHAINGLHENDFILAAKIDQL